MATLLEDLKVQAEWTVKFLELEGSNLDFTIDSLMELDAFFLKNSNNGKPIAGSKLPTLGFGPILFSLGAYLGETMVRNIQGATWITDDEDPQGELHAYVKLPNKTEVYPMQCVAKRLTLGNEASIYPTIHAALAQFTNIPFNEIFWELNKKIFPSKMPKKKAWWKFK